MIFKIVTDIKDLSLFISPLPAILAHKGLDLIYELLGFFRIIDNLAASPNRVERGLTAQRQFMQYKSRGEYLGFRGATKRLNPGIAAVAERLRCDENGTAGLYFFEKAAATTFNQMLHYCWDDRGDTKDVRDPVEKPLDKDNHGPDCVRYLEILGFRYKNPQEFEARKISERALA